jgi:hypothetical protein
MTQKTFDKAVKVKTFADCYHNNRFYHAGSVFYLQAGHVLGSYMEVIEDLDDANDDGQVSDLEKMTVKQLQDLAVAESIDLGDKTKKADIVAAIEAARTAKAALS